MTDSAVRITHLPTGIVASCQNERSQHQNRDRAMQILKAKLAELAAPGAREAELDAHRGASRRRSASAARSARYVLQPYQMVKDLRTEHETGNVDGVLDGDLDAFMEAYLRWKRAERDGLTLSTRWQRSQRLGDMPVRPRSIAGRRPARVRAPGTTLA